MWFLLQLQHFGSTLWLFPTLSILMLPTTSCTSNYPRPPHQLPPLCSPTLTALDFLNLPKLVIFFAFSTCCAVLHQTSRFPSPKILAHFTSLTFPHSFCSFQWINFSHSSLKADNQCYNLWNWRISSTPLALCSTLATNHFIILLLPLFLLSAFSHLLPLGPFSSLKSTVFSIRPSPLSFCWPLPFSIGAYVYRPPGVTGHQLISPQLLPCRQHGW